MPTGQAPSVFAHQRRWRRHPKGGIYGPKYTKFPTEVQTGRGAGGCCGLVGWLLMWGCGLVVDVVGWWGCLVGLLSLSGFCDVFVDVLVSLIFFCQKSL